MTYVYSIRPLVLSNHLFWPAVIGPVQGERWYETDQAIGNYYLYSMNERFKFWLKRVGWGGFLFFLIKGLLWLLIPYLIAKGILSK
ncbi:hypothetical protein [Spirosoma horti]